MPALRRCAPLLLTLLAACSGQHAASSRPAHPTPVAQPAAERRAPDATTGKPNVVVVLVDDLSTDLLPYLPVVQQMQREGTSFSHYVVTDSLCCPSRSSLFTGDFPHDTGVFTNLGSDGGFAAFHGRKDDQSTFATDLQARGYRTALFGKYLNGYLPAGGHGQKADAVPPGWTDWAVAGDGYPEYDYTLATGHGLEKHGHGPRDYMTDVLSQKAHTFIASSVKAGRPFMVEVSTFAPHSPFVPAARDLGSRNGLTAPRDPSFDAPAGATQPKWLQGRNPLTQQQIDTIDRDFRLRAESMGAINRMLGRLRHQLTALGVARNTYVVFTSDNGFHLGQHRLPPGKETAFDTDVQVPFVVTGPDVAVGRTSPELASNIDLRPTLDRISGARVLPAVDGTSLLPLLRGGSTWSREAVLVEHHGPHGGPGDPDVPANTHTATFVLPTAYEAIRTQTELWVEYVDGEVEHYDLTTDPYELHEDSASLTQAHRDRLHALLQGLKDCHGQAACQAADHLPAAA